MLKKVLQLINHMDIEQQKCIMDMIKLMSK